jgi:ParB-like chromosome segregation protein Spo0J
MAKRRRLDPLPQTGASLAETETVSGLAAPFATPRRAPIADMAGEASATAALREVSETLTRARAEGLLIERLPLEAVEADYLVRDRIATDAEEMAALVASIRARGQQTAIEVVDLGQGRYGLISGWRRLAALRELAESGAGPDTVLAIVRVPGQAAEAYRAMVEENEIRIGLSYYERARIVARAADRGVFPDDRAALSALFAHATRPRRSKIGSFVRLVRALDGELRFPSAIPERLGLALVKALEARPDLEKRLKQSLKSAAPATAEAEAAVLQASLRRDRPATTRARPALPPGIDLRQEVGRLTLTGAAVDHPAFASALTRWLARKDWEKS